MAKRSSTVRQSELVSIESAEVVVEETLEEIPTEIVVEIFVQLTRDKRVNVIGNVTGKLYEFSGAGAIVPVDERDLSYILSKGNYVSCCGSQPTPMFVKR